MKDYDQTRKGKYKKNFHRDHKIRNQVARGIIRSRTADKQRKRMAKRGLSYLDRWAALRQIGFASYKAYLKSKLWAEIKQRVFRVKGRFCLECAKRGIKQVAWQVHHRRYSIADLTGETLDYLDPICRPCHTKLEFDENGQKLHLNEVNRRQQTVMDTWFKN